MNMYKNMKRKKSNTIYKRNCRATSNIYLTVHLLNEIKNLLVVHKLDVTPINFFLCIFFLLHLKNMLLMEICRISVNLN
jgi:hypothetical protein